MAPAVAGGLGLSGMVLDTVQQSSLDLILPMALSVPEAGDSQAIVDSW